MANQKVPQLPVLSAVTGDDLFYVVDVSDTTDDPTGSSKQITRDNVLKNITGLTINGNLTVTGNTQSLFSGNTSSDIVRITQTGSGNAFVVEDSASPDSTAFAISNAGDTGIGMAPNSSYKLSVSATTSAIKGESTNQIGVVGYGYVGVQGTSLYTGQTAYGVQGNTDGSGAGVIGFNYYGNGWGVRGVAVNGTGVSGEGGIVGVKGSVYSDGAPIGVYGYVSDLDGGGTDYIAGKFEAAAGTNRYSLQLLDGTQGVNKILISTTSDGKANWSSNLTGLTSISATTYYNLPTDIRVTGGTYSGGTTIFTNNTGGTFSVSGFNTSVSPISVVNTSSLFSTGLSNTGLNASGVTNSIFMGSFAGYRATGASSSNFFGFQSGLDATDANESNFLGPNSGFQASGASASNFFGNGTGANAYNALHSNFIGTGAGSSAYNAYYSNFIGYSSGDNANNASYSNLFGFNVGKSFPNNNIGPNNIIIGTNISLPSGTTNSINIGGVLFGVGTYSGTTGSPSISGNTIGRIGIGVVNPTERLHVSGNTLIQGGLTADTISATTYYNLPTDIRVTGGTYSAGTATFTNNTGGTFSVSGFTNGGSTFTGGTVSGATNFTNGLTANTISTESVIFNTGTTISSPVAGEVYYNSVEKSISYNTSINEDVIVNIGQQNYIRVFNNSGAEIPRGKALEVLSAYGGLPSVTLAINTHTGFNIIGISAEIIPNNSEGIVITNGIISDIQLTGMTIGSLVYASDTIPGDYVSNTLFLGFPLTARTNSVGYVVQTGTTTGKLFVNIENENSVLSLTDLERNVLEGNTLSTGLFEFTGMTTGSTTTFNVAPLKGWIIKNTYSYATSPDAQSINYSGGTNISVTNISTADSTYVLVSSGLTITQQVTYPTPQQRRENIYLGKINHPNRSTILNINNQVDYDVSPMSSLRDLWSPIKLINDGIIPSPNGANLSFNTSAGALWGNGINWYNNQLSPNNVNISAKAPATFNYRTQTGGTSTGVTVIDPTKYDVGGAITSIGNANLDDATNQRIYIYPTGVINVLYGQTKYASLTAAVAAVQSESFIPYPNAAASGILIGILSVRNDIVADGEPLTNPAYAKFTFVSKFGELLGGTGGLSTTTLQQAYNNSTNPEITTNSTLGPVSIKNGSGTADNVTNLFEVLNSGGTTTMFVRADGYVSGTTFYSGGFTANGTGVTATTVSATTISGTTFYGNGTNLTGVVKGSGTTNYLPKWTGTTGLGNSQIQDNGAGVGIGIAPLINYRLNVYGAVNVYSSLRVGLTTLGDAASIGAEIRGIDKGIVTTTQSDNGGIGVTATAGNDGGETQSGDFIGGFFSSSGGNGGVAYSVQLQDGTEGINKVLISKTSDGKANWSSTLTGLTSVSATTISGTTFYGNGTNLTGVLKGAGTSNYLPRWTGTTSLGDSIIRDDGTNIGINSAPTTAAKVKILGTTANTYTIHAQGGTEGAIYGVNNITNGYGVIGSGYGYGVYGTAGYGGYGVYGSSSAYAAGVLVGVKGTVNGMSSGYGPGTGVYGSASGDYGGIGVYGSAGESETGSGVYLGGKFVSTLPSAGGTNYSVQLMDGTEGLNKVLISATSDGKSNWSSNLTGLTSVSATTISGGTIYVTTIPTNNDTNTQILSRNSTTGKVEYIDATKPVGTFNYGLANAIMTGNFLT